VPYLAVGAGALTLEQESGGERDTDPMVNYGGGFKYFFNQALALRGDIRHVYPMDEGRNNLLYTFGLTFVFGGVAEQPPTPPADSDGDGVIDFLDNCRDTPAGVAVDEHGCPKDSDGDGVLDAVDRCPNTPAGTPVDVNGCAKDSDGDGVPDVTDRCPGTPAGTPVGVDGCPKDSDGDGVIDSRDQCPSTPAGAKVDARGCWVLQGVRFDSGKATLTPSSGAVLQEVLTVLKQNSSLKVEIQGHTDSTGSKDLNQRLSEARAKAVKAYFTASGIDADRLTVRGFGPDRPAASNDTQEGRAQNRRVELMPLP
jgi:OOP family OmpA-OmpF porin